MTPPDNDDDIVTLVERAGCGVEHGPARSRFVNAETLIVMMSQIRIFDVDRGRRSVQCPRALTHYGDGATNLIIAL